jgi:hypothetical protein
MSVKGLRHISTYSEDIGAKLDAPLKAQRDDVDDVHVGRNNQACGALVPARQIKVNSHFKSQR